jgi:hypothetical protein
MYEDLTSFEFLNVRSLAYLPNPSLPFYWLGFFTSGLWRMWRPRHEADTQDCPCSAFTTQLAIFILQWLVHCPSSHYILFLMEPNRLVLDLSRDTHELHFGLWAEPKPGCQSGCFLFLGSWMDIFLCMCAAGSLYKIVPSFCNNPITMARILLHLDTNHFLHTEEGGREDLRYTSWMGSWIWW